MGYDELLVDEIPQYWPKDSSKRLSITFKSFSNMLHKSV